MFVIIIIIGHCTTGSLSFQLMDTACFPWFMASVPAIFVLPHFFLGSSVYLINVEPARIISPAQDP